MNYEHYVQGDIEVYNLKERGLSFADIARVLGISNSEARRSYDRAKYHLELKKYKGDDNAE
jgi:DNA-directed RNA polymerase specialized sigma24 family protein